MSRKLIYLLVVFMCTSCALLAFKAPWPHYTNAIKPSPIKDYSPGIEFQASVGSHMIGAWTASSFTTFYRPTTENLFVWQNRPVSTNHRWQPLYIYDESVPLYVIGTFQYFHNKIGVIIHEDGTIVDEPALRIDGRGSIKRHAVTGRKGKVFQKVIEPSAGADKFKFELVYSGKSNNNISLMYREYNNDFARTAFYQNLNYNLDESKIIKFKDLTIEVLNATNSEIQFKVISDEDLSWMPYQS